jgi:hypothetical protein
MSFLCNGTAFVHIPKAAGGSIGNWFKTHIGSPKFVGHLSLDEMKPLIPHFAYNISFTVTRNTYERMVSMYLFAHRPERLKKMLSRAQNDADIARLTKQYDDDMFEWDNGIENYIQTNRQRNEKHTISQMEYIRNVDIVIDLDNLDQGFKQIQEHTGCFEPLTRASHVQKYNPKEYYTDSYIQFIQDTFPDEIAHFGYVVPDK